MGVAVVIAKTGAQLNGSIYTNQFPKFLAPEVRIGVWVARNISGPASVIDDSQPYTFCEAYAAGEHYFPDDLKTQGWYQPTPRGLEGKIAEKLRHLRELDDAWHRRHGKDQGE